MKTTHYRACHLCEAICGLAIEVEDQQILSIKGDPQDPFSRGHICPKATALQDLHTDPQRLRQPQKKVAGKWQSVSWEEAFAEIAERLQAIQAEHGRHSVAVYMGNPNVHNFGSMTHSNYFLGQLRTRQRFSATSVDQLPHHLVSLWMYGHMLMIPIPDIDHTDYFLMLGANPLASNGSIMTVPDVKKRLKSVQQRGGKLLVVDPRRSETADIADEHQFIRPGTDAAFLLAILHTLFAEGLTRNTPVMEQTSGLQHVREAIAEFDAARMAPVCGIAAEDIQRIAREFAAAERAVCYGRMGVSVQAYGTLCQWVIQLINLVTGRLDAVGGAMLTEAAFDVTRMSKPGHFDQWRSRVSGLPEFNGELPSVALAEEMLTPGDGQVRALITSAGNPVLSTPNGRQLDQALAGLDFMVSVDLYVNETTQHADFILPPTSPLEHDHYDITFNSFAVRNVTRYNQPVFAQPEGALHDWEIFVGLGKAFADRKGEQPRETKPPAEMIDAGLQAGPYAERISLDVLRQHPHGIDLGPLQPSLLTRLQTGSGQIEAAPTAMLADLERFAASLTEPVDGEQLLLIGRRHVRSNNSWMHNYQRLVKGKPRHQLLMHPDDMQQRQLADGQQVSVRSRVGELEVMVTASEEMMPGVVSLPHGWGHDREGVQQDVARAHAGVSANDLTDELRVDAVTGNAAVNGVPVEVVAA
ncbi:molybdopterin oxidoreductase family protein [Halopseudomonas salegens]|uniref:Anaerobic selenocysteine-containing dehydrogenase n=1 Tax=Halopseudomonas salegens TaxID=1434072 RepID=A0A1H2FZ92_9GAMM|nr:molybdopterin oxidoreductase family protein [Halopseudomonas salegens]SDU12653.1 Anaerobic selenocysteine-containing dehydrogenase [Halopseudomonas salegens]